jgi:uncharacterized protein (UPF0332 family)
MFNWKLFLDLAEELAQSEDEARRRTAISRAYYAVVGIAKGKVKKIYPNAFAGYHEKLWREFESSNSNLHRNIATKGMRLKNKRNRADYDGDILNLERETESAIKEAHNLLKMLESMK